MTSLFEARGVCAAYGERTVLDGVDLVVDAGECVAVVGANGAGKSTLLAVAAGLFPTRRGTVVFDGRPLGKGAAVRRGLVLCPEGRQLFPQLTVLENLQLGMIALRPSRAALAAEVERVLDLFPAIAKRRGQRAGTLSGGEQQMVALGRALMASPRLLVLDEPTHGLAPLLVADVMRSVRHIAEGGCAVLLAEQNVHASLEVAHRAYVLESGRFVLEGPSRDVLADAGVLAAYLGIDTGAEPSTPTPEEVGPWQRRRP